MSFTPYLKFYDTEKQLFPEAYEEIVTDAHACLIVRKLAQHFKINKTHFGRNIVYDVQVEFRGQGGGHANSNSVTLPHNPSVGMVCHEVAHVAHTNSSDEKKHHTKKLMTIIRRLNNYAKKKNYWKEEWARKIAPKPAKPVPTKKEITEKKLAHAQAQIKLYETKIKRSQTILKKWQRREKRLKTQLTTFL